MVLLTGSGRLTVSCHGGGSLQKNTKVPVMPLNSEPQTDACFSCLPQYCNGGDLAEYLQCKLAIWPQSGRQWATVQ